MRYILLRRRKLGRSSCRGIQAAMKHPVIIMRNDLRLPNQGDFVFRWGCNDQVPDGCTIINQARAISEVADKTGFRKILDDVGLCPQTYFDIDDIEPEGDALIVRPQFHHQGRKLFYCRLENELQEAIRKCGPRYYISEYIDKKAEYRVAICQGRAVWVTRKIPADPKAIAWNVAQGGRFENVHWDDWPLRAVRIAIEGFNLSKLDFGAVDIMEDKNGHMFILELNSAPSQTSLYRTSCFAKAFDYLIEHGKQRIPLIDRKGGYRKFIHPGVCENAMV